jgi:hypothetical protein
LTKKKRKYQPSNIFRRFSRINDEYPDKAAMYPGKLKEGTAGK